MQKNIVVCGYGPGISHAVANKFGSESFHVALVARTADKLEKARLAFEARGFQASVFPADLSQPGAAQDLIQRVKVQLGPVTAIHWNAYAGAAGDIMSASAADLRTVFDVAVTSLVLAVQMALEDLRAARGAVLVTNGGLGLFDPAIDAMAVQWGAMSLAIANAAKHKLVGLLREKLRADEITVGEVVVNGMVKGSAWDNGSATIDPITVAHHFWDIYSRRESKVVSVS
jgi:short-subunit dehydrogenase